MTRILSLALMLVVGAVAALAVEKAATKSDRRPAAVVNDRFEAISYRETEAGVIITRIEDKTSTAGAGGAQVASGVICYAVRVIPASGGNSDVNPASISCATRK